jgi:hypothetical protein
VRVYSNYCSNAKRGAAEPKVPPHLRTICALA